jgi:hypothetical protein
MRKEGKRKQERRPVECNTESKVMHSQKYPRAERNQSMPLGVTKRPSTKDSAAIPRVSGRYVLLEVVATLVPSVHRCCVLEVHQDKHTKDNICRKPFPHGG